MAQNSKGAEVQAMPIESDTFIGIASNHKPIGGTIQVVDGCNLTFHFPTGDKIITAEAGSNFQAGLACTGITSSGEIILT